VNDSVRLQIERYLGGDMSPEEVAGFLATVRVDPEAMAFLGHALEDQAHLFDAIRASRPAERRGDTTRRFPRRPARARRGSGPVPNRWWVVAIAAAGLFALLLSLSTSGSRPRPHHSGPPRDMARAPDALPEPLPAPSPPPGKSNPDSRAPSSIPAPARVESPPSPRVPESPLPPASVPIPPRPDLAFPHDPAKPTAVALAVLDRLEGEAMILDAGGRTPAKAGMPLASGQGVQSSVRAVVKFADKSTVELGAATTLCECSQGPGGKRLRLEAGLLAADVAKQGGGSVFLITTPQAEVTVVGTKFSVACSADSTRVDVREGRVRVSRVSDGASVEVGAEQFTVIAPGTAVEVKPFPIDEILLAPAKGVLVGSDWRLQKDAEASTGVAFDSQRAQKPPLQDAPCVRYSFSAEAGKTYYVWVRGACTAKADRVAHDAVILDFGGSEVTEPSGPNAGLTGSLERGLFNGFMHHTGYGWVGSDSDRGRDVPPVTVRFARPGRQTLKLYSWESPMRIDAIWLSATQKTRPDDAQTGPKK